MSSPHSKHEEHAFSHVALYVTAALHVWPLVSGHVIPFHGQQLCAFFVYSMVETCLIVCMSSAAGFLWDLVAAVLHLWLCMGQDNFLCSSSPYYGETFPSVSSLSTLPPYNSHLPLCLTHLLCHPHNPFISLYWPSYIQHASRWEVSLSLDQHGMGQQAMAKHCDSFRV